MKKTSDISNGMLQLEQKLEVLKELALFAGLETQTYKQIALVVEERSLEKGVSFIIQGEPVEGFYIIQEGIAGIVVKNEVVAERSTGDYLGEMGALLDEMASATVRAETPLKYLYISKEDFKKTVPSKTLLYLLKSVGERRKSLGLRLSESLRHTPQGLVKLNSKGEITSDISDKCVKYLGACDVYEIRNKRFVDLIEPSNPGFKDQWSVYPLLFNEEYPSVGLDMMLELLPKQIVLPTEEKEKSHFSLTYYPCLNLKKRIVAIDIGLVDITSREKLKKIQAQETVLQKIYNDPESFFDFLKLVSDVEIIVNKFLKTIKQVDFVDDDIIQLKRVFHTLKGTAGIFSLNDIQELAHKMEAFVEQFSLSQKGFHFMKKFIQLKKEFEHQRFKLKNITAQISDNLRERLQGITFSKDQFIKVKNAALSGDIKKVRDIISFIDSIPIISLAENLKNEVEKLSDKQGKKVNFKIEGGAIRIPKSIYSDLKILVHLIRNAVDHGIERPEKRQAVCKPEVATIIFKVSKEAGSIKINITDDGIGINRKKVIQQAIQQKIIDASSEVNDPLQFIFLPNFSTSDRVTKLSGRGIGLNAVYQTITEELKGEIKVTSVEGERTSFVIQIPVSTDSYPHSIS